MTPAKNKVRDGKMSHEQVAPIAVARRLASELPPEEMQAEVSKTP